MSDTTTEGPNVAMLKDVLQLVEAARKAGMWNQSLWFDRYLDDEVELTYRDKHWCNTAACFAGWAVLLDGWKVEKGDDEEDIVLTKGDEKLASHEVEYVACDLLGLTPEEGNVLFAADNNITTLRRLVKSISKGVWRD